MTHYSIIKDEQALREFIEWLPNLEPSEVFVVALFAKKRYSPEILKGNHKNQLTRFTATKKTLLDKIRQLEVPVGSYKVKGGVEVPQESLVLYMHPNPRCMNKATRAMGKHCWDLLERGRFNLINEAMTTLHKSKSRTFVVNFDIDTDINMEERFDPTGDMWAIFGDRLPNPYRVLKTRGGYHLLVNPSLADLSVTKHNLDMQFKGFDRVDKNWYGAIKDMFGDSIDVVGDHYMPVPGCVQGGFVPYFIY